MDNKNFCIMIKPASSKCNANCRYCFYRDEAEARKIKDYGNFTEALSSVLIDKTLAYVGGGYLSIVFQGGEPTLCGYEFFKAFFEELKVKNTNGAKINLSLQTNGLLIDKKWARLFKAYDVLVGLSLDGDRKSCAMRVKKDEEMFPYILEAARILKEESVSFNILSVIHKGNAKRGKQIYEDLTKRGFVNLQFIPYLGDNPEFKLSSEDYASFLIDVYALYARDFRVRPTRIRQFDNYLMILKNGFAEQCGMNGRCEENLVFEGDGRAYPCDFYCTDEYELGNIKDKNISELLNSEIAVRFRAEKNENEACPTCPYYKLCRGGCKRYMSDKVFCEAYKIFFAHSLK